MSYISLMMLPSTVRPSFREIRNLVMAEMAMVMAIMRAAIMLRKMMIMRMRRRVGVINRVI
jgi:hypothetical protein